MKEIRESLPLGLSLDYGFTIIIIMTIIKYIPVSY